VLKKAVDEGEMLHATGTLGKVKLSVLVFAPHCRLSDAFSIEVGVALFGLQGHAQRYATPSMAAQYIAD